MMIRDPKISTTNLPRITNMVVLVKQIKRYENSDWEDESEFDVTGKDVEYIQKLQNYYNVSTAILASYKWVVRMVTIEIDETKFEDL